MAVRELRGGLEILDRLEETVFFYQGHHLSRRARSVPLAHQVPPGPLDRKAYPGLKAMLERLEEMARLDCPGLPVHRGLKAHLV